MQDILYYGSSKPSHHSTPRDSRNQSFLDDMSVKWSEKGCGRVGFKELNQERLKDIEMIINNINGYWRIIRRATMANEF